MDRVLGIDGGGTKTDIALVDRAGRVLRRSRAAGLDPTGESDWQAVLNGIAAEIGPVAGVVLGLPYHGEIAAISQEQAQVAARVFGAGARVLNDVEVAFGGALCGAEGVLILAGTGSMAWARGPLGTHRVGGWGDLFGDEGSAFWIGREALGRVSQALDGRRSDRGFARVLLARIGIAPEGLIAWAYGLQPQRAGIAGLAAEVSALAQAGEAEAQELMEQAAGHLADHGLTAARLCGTGGPWSFAGGVMQDPQVMRLLTVLMGSAPQPPVLPPVGGAVLRAAQDADWDTGDAFVATLQAGLTRQDHAP
jgi:N-acetylglucosamine kinase-like BadF-type ATPase